jgi:eukaryotic-like serine/threonine-protein kinase
MKPPLPTRTGRSSAVAASATVAAPAGGALRIEAGAIVAGKYRLDKKLSDGGMGSVWSATHLSLATPVAIKFMTVRIADDAKISSDTRAARIAEARARFEREARAAAQLRMANVVQILDYGIDSEIPYIVMELLIGEDLDARLARVRRLTPAEATKLLVPVARALHRAHEQGLVHRDLKPANIFLAKEGDDEVPKILDFGIAKALSVDHHKSNEVTHEGIVLGTPHYMSPEQALNHAIDRRSDLWSVGVILFRVVTGRRPFGGVGLLEAVVEICTAPIPRATDFNPDLPPEIDAFFERALARDPAQRFQSAREMAQTFAQRFRDRNTSWPPPAGESRDAVPTLPAPSSVADAEQSETIQEQLPPRAAPQSALEAIAGEPSEAGPGRAQRVLRRRAAIGGAIVVGGAAAVLALSSLFGRSDAEPSPTPAAQAPAASVASGSGPGPAATLEPPSPLVTASASVPPSPSASAAAAASPPQRRQSSRTATRTTKRTSAQSTAPAKKKRDLGY